MKKQWILIAAAVVLVIALMLGLHWYLTQGVAGVKNITVTVVHSDGQSKDFSFRTQEKYLGPVLLDNGLAEGEEGPYGLYIKVVDGEQAIFETDNAYWSLYVGDEPAVYGADQLSIEDGGVYQLVYTGA
jgi:hypothetical protein